MKAAHSDDMFELFELMSQGVWQIDSEGRTTYVSARIVEMLGFSREELRAVPAISFVDEEDRARMKARIGTRPKGVSDDYECQLTHKNGSLVSVSVNSIPLYRDDGEPDGNLALITDITERKRTAEALAREHTFLTEGQALGHLGSWEYLAATGMTYWSDEECRIYGLPPGTSPPYEELLARHVHPDRNGRDLANALLALFPNLKRMFMSGYTADVLAQYGVAEDGLNFIQKPFTKAELAAKVRETLDGTTRTPQSQI